MRERVALIILTLVATGCVDTKVGLADVHDTSVPNSGPIVVALIDTGVTPYLSAFASQRGLPAHLVDRASTFDFAPEGTYDERWEADAPKWEAVEAGELYWFNGTRLLGISFDRHSQYKLLDGHVVVHGTGTSYLVARDAPEVLIVGVQVEEQFGPTTPYIVDPSVAEAMEWIADQDWINVVSISKGFRGNPPSVAALDPIALRYVRASERAAASGKVIVNAAGNEINPSLQNPFAGPPWVIAVGGSAYGGEPVEASKFVDVVANYSEIVPKSWTINETRNLHGTSYATPIVAATVARAMGQVRAVMPGHDSSAAYREALNASAWYHEPTDLQPGTINASDPIGTISEHSLPILVQSQEGWGYVDASLASEIARRVLENDLASPPEKNQANLFQPQRQQARERYWAAYNS